LALEAQERSVSAKALSEIQAASERPGLFDGFRKIYRPLLEGERADEPEERHRVQRTVSSITEELVSAFGSRIDVELAKDRGNMVASAPVTMDDGETLFEECPPTFLLWLDKLLEQIKSLVERLPVLDDADSWEWDEHEGEWRSGVTKTLRTRKEPQVIVKYDATPEHPAQTELVHTDRTVGEYEVRKFSGRCSREQKRRALARIAKVITAVRLAKERANSMEVLFSSEGDRFLRSLLVGLWPSDAARGAK
jgi:hypothetical protein